MIAFLKGHIEETTSGAVLLDVQGVGYKVEVSAQTLEQLSTQGGDVKLFVYHHITENDQRLFGFSGSDEKSLFEKLITVKGVGPKLGLTILSGLPALNLIAAITQSDAVVLARVPGIGKKTAERIIVELKEKLREYVSLESGAVSQKSEEVYEVTQALESLGFKTKEAEQAILTVLGDSETANTSELIRKALSILKRR